MLLNSFLNVLRSSIAGCRVALLPVQNLTGSLSYDLSRYLGIQSVGRGINHYCVEALGMPGVTGTGGIDSAGQIVAFRKREKSRLPGHKATTENFASSSTRHYRNSKTIP